MGPSKSCRFKMCLLLYVLVKMIEDLLHAGREEDIVSLGLTSKALRGQLTQADMRHGLHAQCMAPGRAACSAGAQ